MKKLALIILFLPGVALAKQPRYTNPDTPNKVWQDFKDIQDDLDARVSLNNATGTILTAQGIGNYPKFTTLNSSQTDTTLIVSTITFSPYGFSQTNIPSVEVNVSKIGNVHFDNFDRTDRIINLDKTPTGDQWICSGPAQNLATISTGMFVSNSLVYCDIDTSTEITKVSVAFSFVHSTTTPNVDDLSITPIAVHADRDQIGLNTMLHITIGPKKWGLDFYNNGVVLSGVLGDSLNLATDGTIYGLSYTIIGSSLTIYPPQGPSQIYTNNTISTTTYRYFTLENQAYVNAAVGRWHAFETGNTLSDKYRALGGGVPGTNQALFLSSATIGYSNAAISGSCGNIITLSLSPGNYNVYGIVNTVLNGATMTRNRMAISTNTANIQTDQTSFINDIDIPVPSATSNVGGDIPLYHLTLNVATVVYLKGCGSYTGGPPQYGGSIGILEP